jgi:hypothetical protein
MTEARAISQDIRRFAAKRKRDASTLRAACAVVLTMVGALAVVFLVAASPTRAERPGGGGADQHGANLVIGER